MEAEKDRAKCDLRRMVRGRCNIAGFKGGERDHEPLKSGKGKETDSLLKPPERNADPPTS